MGGVAGLSEFFFTMNPNLIFFWGGGGRGGRVGWLVGYGFNGPLRQYFSLYRAVSQREGKRDEKG